MKKCIKNLYKSTYKGYAFLEGKSYIFIEEDEGVTWIRDEFGKEFSFSTSGSHKMMYSLSEYFE